MKELTFLERCFAGQCVSLSVELMKGLAFGISLETDRVSGNRWTGLSLLLGPFVVTFTHYSNC